MSKKVLIVTYYWPPSGGSCCWGWFRFSSLYKSKYFFTSSVRNTVRSEREWLAFVIYETLVCVRIRNKPRMKDFEKIQELFFATCSGWISGMLVLAPIGFKIFGPIGDNPDIWLIIGGFPGASLFFYNHWRLIRERSDHKIGNK